MLEPVEEAVQAFNAATEICSILGSRFLVLETPAKLVFSDKKMRSIKNFFGSISFKGLRLVWEVRRPKGKSIPPELVAFMQDNNITHCVDLSREYPAEEEFIYRVAETLEQAQALIEAGFQYVTDMNGAKLFRKRRSLAEGSWSSVKGAESCEKGVVV